MPTTLAVTPVWPLSFTHLPRLPSLHCALFLHSSITSCHHPSMSRFLHSPIPTCHYFSMSCFLDPSLPYPFLPSHSLSDPSFFHALILHSPVSSVVHSHFPSFSLYVSLLSRLCFTLLSPLSFTLTSASCLHSPVSCFFHSPIPTVHPFLSPSVSYLLVFPSLPHALFSSTPLSRYCQHTFPLNAPFASLPYAPIPCVT